MTVEEQLKQEILSRYKSVRAFTSSIQIPYSTLDSVFKRGISNAGVGTMIRVFNALDLDIESIQTGQLTGREQSTKKAPSVSDEALKVARRYHQLDAHGRATVRAVLEEEENRMEEEKQLASPASEKEAKVIPLYLSPAAAGYAAPVFGEEYEDYTLKDDDPQGAMFAVKLQGDSMEPQFPDGSIVFCNKDPVQDGDIGIFYVGSGTVCKQFHQRGRIIYLFSLNRKRSDADMMVFPESNQTFVCQGRVITRRRFPTPGK